jgi:hypothetical protein
MQTGCFPSAIRHLLSSDGFNVKEHPDFVEDNNKAYYIGYSALESDKGLRIRSSEFMLENLPLLLKRVYKEKKNHENPDILVLGTPFQEWQRLRDKFTLATKEFGKEIYCIPQAAAASLIIPPKNHSLVLDIGFNTCDIVPIDSKGRVIADEGVSWSKLGVSALLEDVDNFIKNAFGIALSPANLENILERPKNIKKFMSGLPNEFIEKFEEKISDIIKDKFYFINAKLVDKFGAGYDRIILVGGGAVIYKKHFKKVYSKKIISLINRHLPMLEGLFCLDCHPVILTAILYGNLIKTIKPNRIMKIMKKLLRSLKNNNGLLSYYFHICMYSKVYI